jgi:two-component system, cell cycle sensor histidine kinase and response regulator CckA
MNRLLPVAPGNKLVIVEDESILALDMERSLKAAGFKVLGVAADSDSALELVSKDRPDLVLMDIRIQGTRDGIETAQQIKAQFDLPIVYLTAHSDPGTIARAQATEPMGYLVKPFKKPDLQNVVSIALVRSAQERKLRLREELLSTTLRCIGEAILSSDGEGRITYANAAAERLLERSSAELMGKPLREMLPLRAVSGEALATDPLEDVKRTHQSVRFEGHLEGTHHKHVVAGTAAAVHQGDVYLGVVVALRDVTELLDARQQLEFSERLAALGTLAAGVAHEVNNPLSVVLSNVGFALELSPPQGEMLEALTDARDAAARVAHIIESLRDFSRPHVEPFRAIDAREAIGSALHLTHAQWKNLAGIRLELGAMPPVMAAPARLVQVLVSLIINAVQSMEKVGAPRVLTVSSRTDARGWGVLSVADDGPGISSEVARRIFDPFFTTKPPGKGTGLGLSIARSIVEHHRGELSLDEPPGGGARFHIALPPALQPAPAAPPLDAWWVGPATAESEALCPGKRLDSLADLSPTLGADVLFVHVPSAEELSLKDRPPELDQRGVLVDLRPPPGLKSVRLEGLDPDGLAALVRRGR